MIDLALDPLSPGHDADLARVGEELDPDPVLGRAHVRVVGGWRVLSGVDPWYPTEKERGKGRWSRGANRLVSSVEGDREPTQREVDVLRRHCGGGYLASAHRHWRALAIGVEAFPSPTWPGLGTPVPPLALLSDQEVVVLVRRSAGEGADQMQRLADVRIGAVTAGHTSPVRDVWLPLVRTGRDLVAAAIGRGPHDGLIVQARAPLAGAGVAPLSATAPNDHLRWRFADGSWLDVQLPHPDPAARAEVLRRIGAAGVTVGSEEPFLLPQ